MYFYVFFVIFLVVDVCCKKFSLDVCNLYVGIATTHHDYVDGISSKNAHDIVLNIQF